jgi:hypothetical protein
MIEELNKKTEEIVVLNVGGKRIETSKHTLTRIPGTMLQAMFSGRHRLRRDQDGSYFLDRDKERFLYVLNYLRTGKLMLPNPDTEIHMYEAVLDEFDYFCIPIPWYVACSLSLSRSASVDCW